MRALAGALAVAAAAVALSWFKVLDFDVFWHLATGELILDTGRLPVTNTFSSLFPSHPWPNPEWLFQALLALVYRAGGWLGVQAAKALLVAALGLALWRVLLRRGLGPLSAAALTLVPLAAMQHRFSERPQLFSYLFFVATVAAVDRARRGRTRTLWALPPLYALWSNLHPEVFIGLLFLGAVAAGELLVGVRDGGRATARGRLLLAVTGACAAATLLNPEGWHVLAFPFLHLFLGPSIEVTEYGPTPLAGDPVFWAVLVLALALLWLRRGPRDWSAVLPVTGLGLLGVLYHREIAYALLAATAAIAALVPREERPGAWMTPRRAGLGAALAAAVALLWAAGLDRNLPYRWGWGVDERVYPVAAADALLAHPWRGPLYNHYDEGGYLIHRLGRRLGVFQDGRVQAYPREFIARVNARFTPEDWPGIVRDYGVSLALVRLDQAGPPYFTMRDWGVVFWDDDWCVLARRGGADGRLLEELEYRTFLPGVDYRGVTDAAVLGRLADEMARNQAERLRPNAALGRTIDAVRRRIAALSPRPS